MIGLVIVLLSLEIVSAGNKMEIEMQKLHLYALPVGQGDALVVKCSNNDVTIVDMGSSDAGSSGFWKKDDIQNFLLKISAKVKNIIITHNEKDHYNLIPQVFYDANTLKALENIYISRTFDELPEDLYNWIKKLDSEDKMLKLEDKVKTISGGKEYCWTFKNITPPTVDLCPGVNAEVLFANLGCGVDANTNSIVIRITYNEFSVILNGDFTDVPDKVCGREFAGDNKIKLYRRMEATTVYKLAHHGSDYDKANNKEMLSIIKPKAIFVSANPWHKNTQYGHPRCSVVDYLKDNVETLCKPKEQNEAGQFYCGQHPYPNADILQEKYTCCAPKDKTRVMECKPKNNEYAIYSTTPEQNKINLIELVTDGTQWGFINTPPPKTKPPTKPIKKTPKAGRWISEPSPLLRRLMLGIWGSQ